MRRCGNPACGVGDDVTKLKRCAACEGIQYCSRDCQIAHRPAHRALCRELARVQTTMR